MGHSKDPVDVRGESTDRYSEDVTFLLVDFTEVLGSAEAVGHRGTLYVFCHIHLSFSRVLTQSMSVCARLP